MFFYLFHFFFQDAIVVEVLDASLGLENNDGIQNLVMKAILAIQMILILTEEILAPLLALKIWVPLVMLIVFSSYGFTTFNSGILFLENAHYFLKNDQTLNFLCFFCRKAIYEWDPLEDPAEREALEADESKFPVTHVGHLQVLFANLQFSVRRYIDPSDFVHSLGLDTNQQQDAQVILISSV